MAGTLPPELEIIRRSWATIAADSDPVRRLHDVFVLAALATFEGVLRRDFREREFRYHQSDSTNPDTRVVEGYRTQQSLQARSGIPETPHVELLLEAYCEVFDNRRATDKVTPYFSRDVSLGLRNWLAHGFVDAEKQRPDYGRFGDVLHSLREWLVDITDLFLSIDE